MVDGERGPADRGRVEQRLDELVRQGVRDALALITPLIETGRILSHFDYPVLGSFDSGQPSISRGLGPKNYGGAFRREPGSHHVSLATSEAVRALGGFLLDDDGLRARTVPSGAAELTEFHERLTQTSATIIVSGVLGRLLATVGVEFSDRDFDAVWHPIRNGLVADKLPVEIVLPLGLVTSDQDEPVPLASDVRVEPLSAAEQLARARSYRGDAAAHPCVVDAATHAVVLDGYEMHGHHVESGNWGHRSFFPTEKIERVFQALRLATSTPVGYAQIYMRPLGWALHYDADLPSVIDGTLTRQYPPKFDAYGWLEPACSIDRVELDGAAALYQALATQDAPPNLRLAAKRLSGSQLRHDDDDCVLDLCIALEAALGDEQRSEMTYKLGMRAGALVRWQTNSLSPVETKRRVKHLYDWRSAIVHGKDVGKARKKFVGSSGASEDALTLATNLVRSILGVVIPRPELHSPVKLDSLLLYNGSVEDEESSG